MESLSQLVVVCLFGGIMNHNMFENNRAITLPLGEEVHSRPWTKPARPIPAFCICRLLCLVTLWLSLGIPNPGPCGPGSWWVKRIEWKHYTVPPFFTAQDTGVNKRSTVDSAIHRSAAKKNTHTHKSTWRGQKSLVVGWYINKAKSEFLSHPGNWPEPLATSKWWELTKRLVCFTGLDIG